MRRGGAGRRESGGKRSPPPAVGADLQGLPGTLEVTIEGVLEPLRCLLAGTLSNIAITRCPAGFYQR